MNRAPHWMGEHDYARDLAGEEWERAMSAREYADEARQDRRAVGEEAA